MRQPTLFSSSILTLSAGTIVYREPETRGTVRASERLGHMR